MLRVPRLPAAFATSALLLGCRADQGAPAAGASASASAAPAPPVAVELPQRERATSRRGLGTISARVPGTNEIVGGVTLVSHKVKATVRAGFARTEIEEVWRNDDARALEGTFTFALPASAAITRLALEVDGKLVEGELVEQKRAGAIFRGIVDDTVRPRDPALLDQRGGKVDLKIFPLPPRGGTRRVILAYDEILAEREGQGSYVLPLTSGQERETKIGEVQAAVAIDGATRVVSEDAVTVISEGKHQVSREARDVAPKSDLVVRYERAASPVARHTPRPGEAGAAKGETAAGFVTARLAVPSAAASGSADPRVFVVDVGHGQPADALVDAWEVIDAALAAAPSGAEFAVLACDSACTTFPASGLRANGAEARAELVKWSSGLVPQGASDLAGMLIDGSRLAGARGTVALFTRGGATAGELAADAIVARVKAAAPTPRATHLLGVGPFVDEPTLRALSEGLGATQTRLAAGAPRRHAERLDRPVLRAAKLTVPAGFTLVAPTTLPALAAGDEIVVSARATPDVSGEVTLEGELDGAPTRTAAAVAPGAGDGPAFLDSLWARQRIASLASKGDPSLDKELVKLSRDFHVLSPKTSFIVLENEAMFAAFGIPRTSRRADDAVEAGSGKTADGTGAGAPAKVDAPAFGAGGVETGTLSGHGAPVTVPGLGGIGGLGNGSGRAAAKEVGSLRARIQLGAFAVAPAERIPPALVQRIVRQQLGRFRNCAERGLQVDPNGVGRVSTNLAIGPEGAVTLVSTVPNGGVPALVAQCIAAGARGLSFPKPEGGIVTVRFEVVISIDDRPAPNPSPMAYRAPQPSFTPGPPSDAWLAGGDDELAKLTEARDKSPEKRRAHEALVLALVRRGRDATPAARAWVSADPDEARAHGLLAEALAASGAGAQAALELATVAALDPGSQAAQLAAARAYLAAGDARRSCAHVRAAASAKDAAITARAEALRCRADVLGDPTARDEARALADKSPAIKAVADATGSAAVELGTPGALRFEVKCADCPAIAVLTPTGRVVAAAAPSKTIATAHRVDVGLTTSGTYRAVFVGAPLTTETELVLTTPNGPQTIKVPAGTRTLASVGVELPPLGFGLGLGRLGL